MDCRKLLAIAAAALLLGCVESTGPPIELEPPAKGVPDGGLRHLQWADPHPSLFAPSGQDDVEWTIQASAVAEPVTGEQFTASFWVFEDQEQTLEIDYRSPGGNTQPFLRMDIVESSLLALPAGEPIEEGDSVLITIDVDLSQLIVRFFPVGLQFDPAEQPGLTIWYSAANLDLDGDGDIDAADAQIEQTQLHLWARDGVGEAWEPTESTESHSEKYFSTPVINLSGYAVSY